MIRVLPSLRHMVLKGLSQIDEVFEDPGDIIYISSNASLIHVHKQFSSHSQQVNTSSVKIVTLNSEELAEANPARRRKSRQLVQKP